MGDQIRKLFRIAGKRDDLGRRYHVQQGCDGQPPQLPRGSSDGVHIFLQFGCCRPYMNSYLTIRKYEQKGKF
jgi:hypothetical protein